MKGLFSFIFITICLLLLGYVLFGFNEITPLLFSDNVLIGQNIASTIVLLFYSFVGLNSFKSKANSWIIFALTMTLLIWGISIVQYSVVFVFEMIKQTVLPFILTLILIYKNKISIPNTRIMAEIGLAFIFWLGLTFLKYENIYNILISVLILGIAYYLVEMFYPRSMEVYQ